MLIATGMVASAQKPKIIYKVKVEARDMWMYQSRPTEVITTHNNVKEYVHFDKQDSSVLSSIKSEKYKYTTYLVSDSEYPSYVLEDSEGNQYMVHTHNIWRIFSTTPLTVKHGND